MASLMSHTPPSSQNNTLPVPVESPQRPLNYQPNSRGEPIFFDNEFCGRFNEPPQFINNKGTEDITRDVDKSLGGIFFMQVFRNCGVNFSEGYLSRIRNIRNIYIEKILLRYFCWNKWRLRSFPVFWAIFEERNHNGNG